MKSRSISYLLVLVLILSQIFGAFAETSFAEELAPAEEMTIEEKTEETSIKEDDFSRDNLSLEDTSLPVDNDSGEKVDLDKDEAPREVQEEVLEQIQGENQDKPEEVLIDKEVVGVGPVRAKASEATDLLDGEKDLEELEEDKAPKEEVKGEEVKEKVKDENLDLDQLPLIELQPGGLIPQLMEIQAQEPRDLKAIFSDVKLYFNDNEIKDELIEIEKDGSLKITINWEIEDNKDLKEGDYIKYDLPAGIFSDMLEEIPVLDREKNEIGKLVIKDDSMKLVFNDTLVGMKNRAGSLGLILNIDENIFSQNIIRDVTITSPVKKTFKMKLSNKGKESSISKGYSLDNQLSPSYIDWTIDLNWENQEFTNMLVEDKLPEGLELDGEIKLEKVTVGLDDDKLVERGREEIGSKSEFPIEIGNTSEAYRITYRTKITNTSSEGNFTNTAILKDGENIKSSAEASLKISLNSEKNLIKKTGSVYFDYVEKQHYILWEIRLNSHGLNLGKVRVKDQLKVLNENGPINKTFDSELLGYFKGSDFIKINDKAIFTNEGLEIQSLDSPIILRIKTPIANESFVKGYKFINEASLELSDKEYKAESTIEIKNDKSDVKNSFDKLGKVNYETKKIDWTIRIHNYNKSEKDFVIWDDLPEGLNFVVGSLKLTKNYSNEGVDINVEEEGKKLKITIPQLDRGIYVIEYKTGFKSLNNLDASYTNKYRMKSIREEASGKVSLIDWIVKGGKKEGKLNRQNGTIDWTVHINPFSSGGGHFTDHLGPGQTIEPETIKISQYKLNEYGDVVEESDVTKEIKSKNNIVVNPEKQEFTIHNLENRPYKIEYTSKLNGLRLDAYTNEASFKGEVYQARVSYDYHDSYISKVSPNMKDNIAGIGSILNWEVEINKSLSNFTDAQFIDKISLGHEYIKDTFTLYKAGKEEEEAGVDKLKLIKNGDKTETLTYDFGGKLKDNYIIKYATKVTGNLDDKISNIATLKTTEKEITVNDKKEYVIKQLAWADGNGEKPVDSIPWTPIEPSEKPEEPKDQEPIIPLEPSKPEEKPEEPKDEKPITPLEPSKPGDKPEEKPIDKPGDKPEDKEEPKLEEDRPSRPSRPSRPDRDKSEKDREKDVEEDIEENIYHELSKEPEEILSKDMEEVEISHLEEEEEVTEEIFHMLDHGEEDQEEEEKEEVSQDKPSSNKTLPKTGSGNSGLMVLVGLVFILVGSFSLRKKK